MSVISTKNKNDLAGIFKLKTLSTAVMAAMGSMSLMGVNAQTDSGSQGASSSTEEVVVIGIRESMQRNLDIKRESTGVVDAITSEDIGKFPDSNIAASLQRVPGVSIQRSGQRGDPTGITVRGFGGDFNETLVDGRRISTASGGRLISAPWARILWAA